MADDLTARAEPAPAPEAGGTGTEIPRRIEDHAVIGDLSTVALVGTDGTIDFLCWPCFDSPSIFAALLDPERGGHFALAPDIPDATLRQMYLPDTNVLLTRWLGETASGSAAHWCPAGTSAGHQCAADPLAVSPSQRVSSTLVSGRCTCRTPMCC